MTAGCEPNWRDQPDELDRLCQLGAVYLHDPTHSLDLRGQGLTGWQINTITDVQLAGEYL